MTQWSIRSTRNRVCSFVVANKEPREATDRLRNPLALTDSPGAVVNPLVEQTRISPCTLFQSFFVCCWDGDLVIGFKDRMD